MHQCPRRESIGSAAALAELLAAAVHIVKLIGEVCVLAFAAIDLVALPIPSEKIIVAIPAIVDIRSLVSANRVFARPTVEDIVTGSSLDEIEAAKATYLVIALLAAQEVAFVSAQEQATLGAAG